MSNSSRRASIILGGFMIFVLLMGAIVPLISQNTAPANATIAPTTAPTATFPPPVVAESLAFDQLYLHPTGLFAIAQPTGWTASDPVSEAGRAAITMSNNEAQSIIEASVEQPATPITNLDELSARYDETYLDASWARYSDWSETSRRTENDKLLIDFNLTLNRQTYIARQIAWTDGEWIYSTRVVMPSNAPQSLVAVLNQLVNSLKPYKVFAGEPFDWQIYIDNVNFHAIRHPQTWTVSDTAPGRPTSITAPDGTTLRVEARPGAIANAADAQTWVESNRTGATVLSTAPLTRGDVSGFSVAYSFTTVDGDAWSGLAVILNGADDIAHIANLQFPGADVDLNALDATPEAGDGTSEEATAEPGTVAASNEQLLAMVMGSFVVVEPIQLANAPATPTPLPSAAPTAAPETTVEATEAATEDAAATSDATEEATAEDAEATVETTEAA